MITEDRAHILGTLHAQLNEAQQTRRGTYCLLGGPPGHGKTHLVRHFLGQLRSSTATLEGSAPPIGGPPLLPLCRALASDERSFVVEAVTTTLFEYAQSVPVLTQVLGPLLRVERKMRHAGALPQDLAPKEAHTFFVLAQMLRRVAAHGPSVLFLDDVQWLDPSSLAFLLFLADEVRDLPLFVVLTSRTNGTEPAAVRALRERLDRTAATRFAAVKLPPLSDAELLVVAERWLGGKLTCDVAEVSWLRRSSKGNPQFLRELVLQLKSSGNLHQQGGEWRFTAAPEELVVPRTYAEAVVDRVGVATAATPDASRLICYAAALGARLHAATLAKSLGVTVDAVVDALSRIETATGLLVRDGKTLIWEFEHELTREALLAEMGEYADHVHERIGETLLADPAGTSASAARHFQLAHRPDLARDAYERAAREELERGAFQEACAHAETASRDYEEAGDEVPVTLLELRAGALVAAQRWDEAVNYVTPLVSDEWAPARDVFLHFLGVAYLHQATRTANEAAVLALEEASTASPIDRLPFLLADLVVAYDALGDHTKAQGAFRRARTAAITSADDAAIARVFRMSCAFHQPEQVIQDTTTALRASRAGKLPISEAKCLNNLGTQRWYLNDLAEADKLFERTLRSLTRLGAMFVDVPLNNRALVAFVRGEYSRSRELLEGAALSCRAPGDAILIRSNLGAAIGEEGDLDVALNLLQEIVRDADRIGDGFHRDCARHNLARTLLRLGRRDTAREVVLAVPPRRWTTDDALVAAKRARLLAEIAPDEDNDTRRRASAVLDQTTKPQAWLYRLEWELVDLQFWME